MDYQEQPAPVKLRHLLACTWSVQTHDSVPDFPVRPDGCIDVILWPDGKLRVTGAMTRPFFSALAAGSSFVGVRFLPGAATSLLRLPAHELTNRTVLLEEVQPHRTIRDLQDHLLEMCLNCRHRQLAAHFENLAMQLNPVQRAIAHLTAASGAGDLRKAC